MAYKIPTILDHYLEVTEQYCRGTLSEAHLLNEAEWQLYQCEQDGSWAYEASRKEKRELARFVKMLRAKGVKPERDFDD